ncbi:hypothetical protein ACFVWY_04525 [Streptomyces sp. NPDC058195]|uniref:hypothetical protein n=1 Tax=Streptomyces sp. NPDC058195 TaxID=3346375 RepID=UPI0036E3955C
MPQTAAHDQREHPENRSHQPFDLRFQVGGVLGNGREASAVGMELGQWHKLVRERTRHPVWSNSETWHGIYDHDPVGLWVRCSRERHRLWLLTFDVPVTDPQ